MCPDNKIFPCQYVRASEDEYSIALHFNSIQAAKKAALDLLNFIGAIVLPNPQEAPPHKSCEEVTEEADPLTQAKRSEIEFSDMLQCYRTTHGYSQRRLADLLGVSQRTISCWEQGYTPRKNTEENIRRKLSKGEFTHD